MIWAVANDVKNERIRDVILIQKIDRVEKECKRFEECTN